MSAFEFVNLLQQRQLVTNTVLAKLRQQLASSKQPVVSAEQVAKRLVERGLITSSQAHTLLADLAAVAASQAESDSSEIGLAPDEDDETGSFNLAAPLFELDDEDDKDQPASQPPPAARPVTLLEDESLLPDDLEMGGDVDQSWDAAGTPPLAGRRGSVWRELVGLFKGQGQTFRSKQWDSPLILVGGGTLVVLVLIGAFLFSYLRWGSGDELFQQASADYRGGMYVQAMEKYEKFISRFPKHQKASTARVRQHLAQLWQAVEGRQDWDRALATAIRILPLIKNQEAFATDGRPELSSLLPDIYDGFVTLAEQAEDPDTAEQNLQSASEALSLINNSEYLPTSLREQQQPRVEELEARVAVVRREIARDNELADAIAKIQQAIQSNDTQSAYAARDALIQVYPGLASNEQLQDAVVSVTRKEQELVKPVQADLTSTTEARPSVLSSHIVISNRRTRSSIAGLQGKVVIYQTRGAVYALNAINGSVLWRRFVGYGTAVDPQRLEASHAGDVMLVDQRYHELLRIDGQVGELRWRLPVGEPFQQPVVAGDRAWISTQSGRLLEINPSTGQVTQSALLPQRLESPPCLDANRDLIYQAGQHSTLFVLDTKSLECRGTFFLGHEPGNVTVPLALVAGMLLVPDNAGVDFSLIHAIDYDQEGVLQRRGKPLRLAGRVVTPLVVTGRRATAVTERRAIQVFEVDPGSSNPLRQIASASSAANERMTPFALIHEGNLFVGTDRLAKYEMLVARGELVQTNIDDDGDIFQGPIQRLGDVAFHLRQRSGASGMTVSAIDLNTGETLWATDLAVPLAGEVIVEQSAGRVAAVTSHGDLYEFDADSPGSSLVDRPVESVASSASGMISWKNGRQLNGGPFFFQPTQPSKLLLKYDPGSSSNRLRTVSLKFPFSNGAANPVAMGTGLLVPTQSGPVYLVDADQGTPLLLPFQPRLSPNTKIQWARPAVFDRQQLFAIADRRGELYLVGRKIEPSPHLSSQAYIDMGAEVVTQLASIDDVGYVGLRTDRQQLIVSFSVPDLKVNNRWPINGHVTWGPERVGEVVLVTTDSEGLLCFDGDHGPRWTSPLPHGPISGRPLQAGAYFIICSTDGWIWRVDRGTGEVVPWEGHDGGVIETGLPLGAGPVEFRGRLILTGHDGTLFVLQLPSDSESSSLEKPSVRLYGGPSSSSFQRSILVSTASEGHRTSLKPRSEKGPLDGF